jgi:hypothetical protein
MTAAKKKQKPRAKEAPTPAPTATPAADAVVLSLKDAESLTGISAKLLAKALRAGELNGRNLEGRRGWVTTRDAIREWAERGNKTAEVTA